MEVKIKGIDRTSRKASQSLFWPTKVRRITSTFDLKRLHPMLGTVVPHYGLDIAEKGFHEIYASASGEVIKSYTSQIYGECVIIAHEVQGELLTTLYAHMRAKSVRVRKGDWIEQGGQIGIMGSTGRVTGQHLHFELHRGTINGVVSALDPELYLQEESVALETYIVRPGDTISHISRKTGVSADDLININGIKNRNLITIGQVLTLPGRNLTMKFHIVKKGDTLNKISKRYYVPVEKLLQLNKIKNKNIITIGQKIRII